MTTHEPTEGRRARKRREMRDRIADAAMALFLAKGYDGTTMDDVAHAADVSRRSLFDYFATKEDVLFARQDDFVPAIVEAMRTRPKDESWPVIVEHAMVQAVTDAASDENIAIDALVRRTPALAARRQLKYGRMEQAIAGVLVERSKGTAADRRRAAMLAAVVVAGFRLAASTPRKSVASVRRSVARDFQAFWQSLREFGEEGLVVARSGKSGRGRGKKR